MDQGNQIAVELPDKIRRRALHFGYIVTGSFLLIIPALAISFNLATKTPGFEDLGRGRLLVVGLYMYSAVGLLVAFLYLLNKFFLHLIAISVTSLPEPQEESTKNLSKLVRKRFSKTAFVYLSGSVPSTLQRIRVSSTPNDDGTFWMMETDEKLSRLQFDRYHSGQITEPMDPESWEAKYPSSGTRIL